MTTLFCDFETRSFKELRGSASCGLHNYLLDPSTEATILAYKIVNLKVDSSYDNVNLKVGSVKVWFPLWQEMPDDLKNALDDKQCEIVAFNSCFERGVFRDVLGWDLPISRFQDPQASGRYLSLPASLEDQGEILRLPVELQKDKEGKRLLDIFTKPTKIKKTGEVYFRDWDSDPEDWAKFVEYAKRDVLAEEALSDVLQSLGCFPLPPRERAIWILDQKINDRGIPVDRKFTQSMFNLGERAKKDALDELNKVTGLENANSNTQFLKWAQTQGYSKQTIVKPVVAAELEFNDQLTPLCRKALELRQTASSTSYKKMNAILRLVSPDNRLRNQFVYCGSSKCGRWAGSGFQVQNMARPTQEFEDLETVNEARKMIHQEDYNGIMLRFSSKEKKEEKLKDYGVVLSTIKSCIRTVFGEEKWVGVSTEDRLKTSV
jgi:DNA polymerase